MKSLDSIIKEVYAYISTLSLDSKINLLSKFSNTSVRKVEEKYIIDGLEKDKNFTEKYVEQHIQWLKMSEIDKIYDFLNRR